MTVYIDHLIIICMLGDYTYTNIVSQTCVKFTKFYFFLYFPKIGSQNSLQYKSLQNDFFTHSYCLCTFTIYKILVYYLKL